MPYAFSPMSDEWLRIFEAKALAEALTKAGHSVSERTAQRWKAGETHPKPQDIRAIRELVGATAPGHTKEAPPAGADGAFLERWLSDEPPPWAMRLRDEILGSLTEQRHSEDEALKEIRQALGAAARAEARRRRKRPPETEAPDKQDGAQSRRVEPSVRRRQGDAKDR